MAVAISCPAGPKFLLTTMILEAFIHRNPAATRFWSQPDYLNEIRPGTAKGKKANQMLFAFYSCQSCETRY